MVGTLRIDFWNICSFLDSSQDPTLAALGWQFNLLLVALSIIGRLSAARASNCGTAYQRRDVYVTAKLVGTVTMGIGVGQCRFVGMIAFTSYYLAWFANSITCFRCFPSDSQRCDTMEYKPSEHIGGRYFLWAERL